mgnify:FL=1|jgi:hypothetical protein|tara:strand:- start:15244 stop:15627 length:384 start_codon:yes stop_codon:yes gene_type:complete
MAQTDSNNIDNIMSDKENIKTDYETSRDTYLELIEGGKRSLDLMIEVARESEHPRAFEVLSGMIKNVADVTDKLMDLNKKHKEIQKEDKAEQRQITNNNVFLGSTTDLQRFLQNEEKLISPETVEKE